MIKPGTLVAELDSGGDAGKWGAFVEDSTAGTGLDTADGVVYSGGRIRRDTDGTVISNDIIAAVLPSHLPIEIIVANLPGLLNEAAAADPPTAADLPSGFVAMDDLV